MAEFAQCPIDLRYLAENQPSLCIPRVFKNIKEAFIQSTFDKLGLGKIQRIDLIERQTDRGETYNRAFIHFEKWFWNKDAQEARKRLIMGKDIKIVYDNPWFWKVSANKWTPRATDHRGPQLPAIARPHVPTEPFIVQNVAPTLNVGAPEFVPGAPKSHSERRKSKNERRPNKHHRLPQVNDRTPPPPHPAAHIPSTPPQTPPRLRRPSFHEPIQEDTQVCEDEIRNDETTSNEFNVTDVRNISYGNVPYPPPRKIIKKSKNANKNNCIENTVDTLYADIIDDMANDFEIIVDCNEN